MDHEIPEISLSLEGYIAIGLIIVMTVVQHFALGIAVVDGG